MKIEIIGSLCENQEHAKIAVGRFAGVCYMKDTFWKILDEESEKSLARADKILKSGHHSVYDHITYTLLLEDIPKILAMILNNEGMYTTSEKSARYTKMKLGSSEETLYNRWLERFESLIRKYYGEKFSDFYDSQKKADSAINKLAMENARYITSIYTPTTMVYTVSLRQINYIVAFFENFIRESELKEQKSLTLGRASLYANLALYMQEFIRALPGDLNIPELNANLKMRKLSLFRKEDIPFSEHFGDVYSIKYKGTWAELAQAQRHRTIHYQIGIPNDFEVYTPDILQLEQTDEMLELQNDWKKDMESVALACPQGMLIDIYERGTYENFLLKCYERVCGCAQLEIEKQTRATLCKYHQMCPNLVTKDYINGGRCTFPGFKCEQKCVWGAKGAVERKV